MSTVTETPQKIQAPIIKMTEHDQVSSGLYAVVMLLSTGVGLLIMVWVANMLPVHKRPPAVQLLEEEPGGDPHGFIDGVPGETLALGSPDVDASDPTMEAEEAPTDTPDAAESLDPADLADAPELSSDQTPVDSPDSPQVNKQFAAAPIPKARPGSPFGKEGGTGRPPIGFGGGKGRGFPREMRWFVKFVERGTTEDYAAQLDFFGIELGALMPDGKLILVSKLTAGKPTARTVNNGQEEKRLYFTWKGGERKRLDLQIFQKAGITADNALLMHFYPADTENQLAIIERDYRKKKAEEIRKTYFAVRAAKQGFEFTITSQTYIGK